MVSSLKKPRSSILIDSSIMHQTLNLTGSDNKSQDGLLKGTAGVNTMPSVVETEESDDSDSDDEEESNGLATMTEMVWRTQHADLQYKQEENDYKPFVFTAKEAQFVRLVECIRYELSFDIPV